MKIPKSLLRGGFALIGVVILWVVLANLYTRVDAEEVVVVQFPNGKLAAYTEAGWQLQSFGKVTSYPKSQQYWFNGTENSNPVKATFNDGADAYIYGSIRWDMPLDEKAIVNIHTKFGSPAAVEHQLIAQVMSKTVYMTGPLMSSTESYAEKKNTLLSAIEDQAKFGVYATVVEEKEVIDVFTKDRKLVSVTTIKEDSISGQKHRQEKSPIHEFGITLHNLAIDNIKYDETVYAQIQKQQKAKMQVEIAITEAKQAVQNAITAEEEGKAEAARAKWAQEKIKATEVTKAEQQKEVARLAMEEAEYTKRKLILEGEGQAAKKRLVMQADGALKQKLDAYVAVQTVWAEAYAKRNVPQQYFNSGSSAGGYGDSDSKVFQQMLNAMIAKDLMLQPQISK